MVRYSDELIDEIKNKNDIVDIISQYVILKRSGRNFFGLCPFHKEKSPSFSVSPDKQIFHCFGCGVGGNVFHFVQKIENLSFLETIDMLANRAGINLPSLNNNADDKIIKLKSRVYEINEETAKFYHENLYKQTSKEAQNYIKKRKLDNRTLKNFMIGYSGNFNELYFHLKSKGFTDDEILTSGLVNKNDNGKFIDRFRKRLMFPIQDTRNRVIAFGGRVLDDSKPKYINSSENIVYSKGRHLFGLNVAKRNPIKKIIIVEGYMDAISLHQRGITNVVASLGTAMTEAQGRLLRKSSEQVIIGYDSDGAGQAATIRGLEILQGLGCDIRILQIEGAKDPDEFITKYGPERFLKYVDSSISLVEYKIKVLKQELNINNVNDKIKFLKEIAKELSRVNNTLEREVYIEKISMEYKISKEAIYSEINKLLFGNKEEVKRNVINKLAVPQKNETEIIDKATARRESLIIYLLINYASETYLKIKEQIKIEDLKIERNRKIITKLYEELEKGYSNINNILNWFEDEDIINYLTSVMADDFEITEVSKCLDDILNTYQKEKLIQTRNNIITKLESKELTKEEMVDYEKKLNEVIVKLAKIK